MRPDVANAENGTPRLDAVHVSRCVQAWPTRYWRTSNNVPACMFATEPLLEVAGIEPASSGAAIGLLRAQPTGICRGRHHCRRLCRPVTNEDVLSAQLVRAVE